MNPPEWVDRAEFPFHVSAIDVGPGRMHYVDVGPASADRTLLFLHGNPTWSFAYRNVIRPLKDECRCVAPDWLGFGLSDKPDGWSYRPEDHAACLKHFIADLELREFTMIVHDWGGPIGLSVAIDEPDLLHSFVVLNSWLWPPSDHFRLRAFARVAGSSPARYLIRRFNALTWAMPLGFGNPLRLERSTHMHYVRAQSKSRQGCAQLPAEFLASRDWLHGLWTRRSVLNDIPKSIIWGERDLALGKKPLERWLQAFPDASVVTLAKVGHFVPEEDPNSVVRAIRHLTR